MKRLVLRASFVFLSTALLASACSEKKTFSGGAKTGAAKAAEPDPEPTADAVPDTSDAPVTTEVETKELFKDCDNSKSSVFVADLYELEKGTQTIEVLNKLTPVKQICIKQLDIHTREFTEGFPGVEGLKEWFGLKIRTTMKIKKAGTYQFRVNSDDGSIVYIDGKELINNDGTHSTRSVDKTIELSAGSHELEVKYFQGPANQIALELFWTPPGESESYLPLSILSRPSSY